MNFGIISFSYVERTAIAHSIREQIFNFAKSLLLMDYSFNGGVVDDEELASMFLPAVDTTNLIRNLSELNLYGPKYINMSPTEFDKLDKDNQRESRRKRRQTQRSRRAITVPDKEPLRTMRSPIGLVYNSYVALEEGLAPISSKQRALDEIERERYQSIVNADIYHNQLLSDLSSNISRSVSGRGWVY
jgi:hypothetical protein